MELSIIIHGIRRKTSKDDGICYPSTWLALLMSNGKTYLVLEYPPRLLSLLIAKVPSSAAWTGWGAGLSLCVSEFKFLDQHNKSIYRRLMTRKYSFFICRNCSAAVDLLQESLYYFTGLTHSTFLIISLFIIIPPPQEYSTR